MPQVSDSSEIVWWSDVNISDLTNKMLFRAEQYYTGKLLIPRSQGTSGGHWALTWCLWCCRLFAEAAVCPGDHLTRRGSRGHWHGHTGVCHQMSETNRHVMSWYHHDISTDTSHNCLIIKPNHGVVISFSRQDLSELRLVAVSSLSIFQFLAAWLGHLGQARQYTCTYSWVYQTCNLQVGTLISANKLEDWFLLLSDRLELAKDLSCYIEIHSSI